MGLSSVPVDRTGACCHTGTGEPVRRYMLSPDAVAARKSEDKEGRQGTGA